MAPAAPTRRRRGQGSVRLRKDGLWEARLPGNLGRASTYHQTELEATAWLAQALNRAATARAVPGREEHLIAYLNRWYQRNEPRFGRSRAHAARNFLASVRPLWAVPLGELRSDQIADWVASLQRAGQASPTIAIKLGFLKTALSDLVPDVLVANPAARKIRLARRTNTAPSHFEEFEAQRFLKLAAETPAAVYFRVLLGTGIREGEALALRWEQVDLARGVARIEASWDSNGLSLGSTKGGNARDVELVPAVRAALGGLPGERQGYIFLSTRTGRPFTSTWVAKWFHVVRERSAQEGIALPNIRPHGLRHTFASIALARGVPLTTVSATLGHANVSITARTYSHALRSRSGAAEQALSEALGWV